MTRHPIPRTTALAIRTALIAVPLAALTSWLPATAQAQSPQSYRFDIPAGPLSTALTRLGAQSGLLLSVDGALTQGKTAPAVSGDLTPEQALELLLAGSGLRYRFTGADTVTLSGAGAQDANIVSLQAIEVTGRQAETDFAATTFAATKTETHILDVPQSVGIVTKEIIQDQNLVLLNDVAPYVAGVNEFSVYDDLTIRGFRNFDDRRVNGLRVYNNFWSQPYVANVERVEVIKGPSAALYGDASPGGVINIVTKKPLSEGRHSVHGDLGTFGSGNNQFFAAADTTGPMDGAGTFLYRFNASIWDHDSFRTEIFDNGYSLAPSLSWVPDEDTRVNLEVTYLDRKTVLDRGQPNLADSDSLGTVPIDVSVTQPGDALDYQEFTAAVSLDRTLSERWRLAAALQYHNYDEVLREHRVSSSLPTSTSEYNVGYIERKTKARTLSGTVYATGRFETGTLEHNLVGGVDALIQENESRQVSADDVFVFDVLKPVNVSRPVDTYTLFVPSFSPYGADNRRIGVFVQDQLTLDDWDVLFGLRYSRFSTDPIGGEENADRALSPRLGVVYRVNDDLSFYGTYATGFEPNFGYTAQEGGPFDPTTSRLFEIGGKYLAFDGNLLLTAALYHIVNDDIVVYANDTSNPDLYRQRGQEQATGLELEAVGNLSERLSIIANYAYNKAEVTEDEIAENVGKTKEGAPRHALTLWGKYHVGHGFAVGAGVEYVGKRETFQQGFALPSYTVANAGVFYEAGKLSVSLIGKNLSDEEHWTGGYYPGRVFPGNPFRLTLSASYAF